MLLLSKLLPLLAALSVSAQSTTPPPSQKAFSFASLPPSAYSPLQISSNIELGGSLTRSAATYTLEKDPGATTTGDLFVVGIKGGGKSGGWIEATEGKGANRKKLDMIAVGGNE
jgi:oligosaccharyltransferase complex subunit alpha (ribophorin I)